MTMALRRPVSHGFPVAKPKCAWCRAMPCVCIRERPCACGGVIVALGYVAEAVATHNKTVRHAVWREGLGL